MHRIARWRSLWLGLAAALVLAASSGARAAESAEVVQVYPNVFLVPDAQATSVKVWLVVKAGFRDETAGDPGGVAHYLEHLFIFARGGDRKKSSPLLFANADANAFTNYNATAYWHRFPYRPATIDADLEKAMAFFCARIGALDVSEDEAMRERDVVMQEYEWRNASSPQIAFNDANNKILQPDHPIGRPGIGTRESISAYRLYDAQRFHDRFYVKNNIAFVVHGPVDAAALKNLAEKYLAPMPEKPVPSREAQTALLHFEPMSVRNEMSDSHVKQKLVRLEKMVRYDQADRRVGELAGDTAAAFMDSRLEGSAYDELVDQRELAKSIAVNRSPIGAGAIWITFDAEPEDGVAPDALRAAMEDYLTRLATRGISAGVIERLKKRRLADLAELDDDREKMTDAFAFHFAIEGTYEDWTEREATIERVNIASIQPILDALAGKGRELLGILAPAPAAN